MTPSSDLPHDMLSDAESIGARVKSGEYFYEARAFYASRYLNPMAERYFFLAATLLGLLILLTCTIIIAELSPLRTPVPFVYYSENYMDEYPSLKSLKRAGETPNETIQRFLLGQYVTRRESYDINQLELNVRYVKEQSEPEVFAAWQKSLDPANPESPISRFERHATRTIDLISVTPRGKSAMEVVYDAIVEDGQSVKKTRNTANIAFRYRQITVNQKTGKATPLQFVVTDYSTSPI